VRHDSSSETRNGGLTVSGPTILLVDDDDRHRERLKLAIEERGFEVFGAANHREALAVGRDHEIDRAIVDLRMPGPNGLVVIQDLLAMHPDCEILVLTGYGSIATAVEAMRLGARDYITKPSNADRILAAFDSEPAIPTDEVAFETPSLARVEREHIERVLQECNGNISKAARVLGMHRRTLQYKLAKFPVSR
jgi:two-component system, response regulator RegA